MICAPQALRIWNDGDKLAKLTCQTELATQVSFLHLRVKDIPQMLDVFFMEGEVESWWAPFSMDFLLVFKKPQQFNGRPQQLTGRPAVQQTGGTPADQQTSTPEFTINKIVKQGSPTEPLKDKGKRFWTMPDGQKAVYFNGPCYELYDQKQYMASGEINFVTGLVAALVQ